MGFAEQTEGLTWAFGIRFPGRKGIFVIFNGV
jgi:hypothetical protein